MTELYRGLLEILVMRCIEQIESLRIHIRSHNTGHSQNDQIDIGVNGFWNLMLETVFTVFTILFLFLFVCLTATLAIVSYPIAAWFNYGTWLLRNTREAETPPSEKLTSDSPTIIKQKDGQEKK